ncbi:hypothetical protein D3C72_1476910 [compost metagenome]
MPAPSPYTASLKRSESSICSLAKPILTRSSHASTHSTPRNGSRRHDTLRKTLASASSAVPANSGTPCFVMDMESPVLSVCVLQPMPQGWCGGWIGCKYRNGPGMRNGGAGIGPISAWIWVGKPCLARVSGHLPVALADLWITLGRRLCHPARGTRGLAFPGACGFDRVAVRCAKGYKASNARRLRRLLLRVYLTDQNARDSA